MKLNNKPTPITTHEGARCQAITPVQQLHRLVLTSLLWEDGFYESGQSVAERMAELIPQVTPIACADVAIQARGEYKLRHVPLLIAREMARYDTHKHLVADLLDAIIQRPDELTEYLAIYWKGETAPKKSPVSAQSKKGLAKAFKKFSEYQLAKYNRDTEIKLRDVLFISHPKPNDDAQQLMWERLINNELTTPDTWEVELSASSDKKASWTRLLEDKRLGALALLRNLRNMTQAGVDIQPIIMALYNINAERVLPFRFISAYRNSPTTLHKAIEDAMMKCLKGMDVMRGETKVLIDVSGSMDNMMSGKSDLRRIDAACALAILLREICENVEIFSFSNTVVKIPDSNGFKLQGNIVNSQPHNNTYLGKAVSLMMERGYERLIVFTDEQSHDPVPQPTKGKNYMINVAANKNGIGYGQWTHIDGFSESVVRFIQELERAEGD